jgi:hypothetical protein
LVHREGAFRRIRLFCNCLWRSFFRGDSIFKLSGFVFTWSCFVVDLEPSSWQS